MLLSVLLRQLGAFVTHDTLHGRIQDQLLAYGVTGELPNKSILVFGLLSRVDRIEDDLVVLLQLTVVCLDGV